MGRGNEHSLAPGLRSGLLLTALLLLPACTPQNTPPPDDSGLLSTRDWDQDGVTAAADCNDRDPAQAGPRTRYADADGDGYGDPQAVDVGCEQLEAYVSNDQDCDDLDAETHPGALETCDGEDDDCDDETDEYDERREPTGYIDIDGDDHGDHQQPTLDCDLPDGYIATGDDCNDTDAQTYPGAVERCDGLDNDCDGLTDEQADGDQDGYVASDCGGADCDDEDASVSPGAEEICNDGVDNDCDGTPGACGISGPCDLALAEAILAGESADDHSGHAVAGAGDVDMDGFDDLLIGAYHANLAGEDAGAAYLAYGPISGDRSLSGAAIRLLGEAEGDQAGHSVAAAGDTNGNNYADLLVGAPYNDESGDDAGMAYLVQGPLSAELDLAQADARLMGEARSDRAGWCVSGAGDVDANGFDDILVGAYGEDSGEGEAGAVYLLLSPLRGHLRLDEADAKLMGEAASDHAGASIAAAGDTDGDGYDDILLGATGDDDGGSEAGAAYLVLGPVSGELSLESADAKLQGESTSDYTGTVAGAGDLDSDGYDDLLVGAPMQDEGARDGGLVYIVHGPLLASRSLSEADVTLASRESFAYAGSALAAPGDVNGDGWPDLLVGAYASDDINGAESGAAYLLLGPLSGNLCLDGAQAKLRGEARSDFAGCAVAGAGDTDADGNPDLLIGAYSNDNGGRNAGASYLLLGGGM